MAGEWNFRVVGAPPDLDPDERRQVQAEITRLRQLMSAAPRPALVCVDQNPAGILGEYSSLLIEAIVRGVPEHTVLPDDVRQQYRDRRWFSVCEEVLTAFMDQWMAVRQERLS